MFFGFTRITFVWDPRMLDTLKAHIGVTLYVTGLLWGHAGEQLQSTAPFLAPLPCIETNAKADDILSRKYDQSVSWSPFFVWSRICGCWCVGFGFNSIATSLSDEVNHVLWFVADQGLEGPQVFSQESGCISLHAKRHETMEQPLPVGKGLGELALMSSLHLETNHIIFHSQVNMVKKRNKPSARPNQHMKLTKSLAHALILVWNGMFFFQLFSTGILCWGGDWVSPPISTFRTWSDAPYLFVKKKAFFTLRMAVESGALWLEKQV